ncbi:glycosyltransferase family 2 protein [Lachnospiraceae bacterium]|nr:glycosyltransferase family 2 protein [Lachnospiraceae bacterium]
MNIKLSVIVPVYNVEPYIKRCLDSIIHQTYQNLEIILVDDGSTDRSGAICDEYCRADPRIQVIHKKNGGIASARKAGIVHATGEYTTNVDPDDWIETDAFAYMADKLETYAPDMLVLGYKKEYPEFVEEYRQWIADGIYVDQDFWDEFNHFIEKNSFFCQPIDMSLCNKAVKTEMWKKYQMECPESLKKNVDDAVIFPCILNSSSVYVDSKCFYHYCVRNNSILWGNHSKDYERFLILSEQLIKSYSNARYKDKIHKKFLLYKIFYHFILDTPERLISEQECLVYPEVTPKSRIIVYGKGVFANRLMQRMQELQYCTITGNIDKSDMNDIDIKELPLFDYIVIAIFNSAIVDSSVKLLKEKGIDADKLLCIEKEHLSFEKLPDKLRALWNAWV